MKFGLGTKVRNMVWEWLLQTPAPLQTVVIQQQMVREIEIIRSRLWYRGDANELQQFFRQLPFKDGGFWASVPVDGSVRKIHCGLPAVIINTLVHIVKSDIDDIEPSSDIWKEIDKKIDFVNLVGKAIADTLIDGDGAFKISVDESISPYPIVEFVGGDNVEIEFSHGALISVTFKTIYHVKSAVYEVHEKYGEGYIETRLYNSRGNEIALWSVPELVDKMPRYRDENGNERLAPRIDFPGDYIMAVPLKFYDSKKYPGRGVSLFDNGKSDCFDALDEVISQWIDAIRAGRVQKYIPNDMIPRNPDNGSVERVNSFGTEFIVVQSSLGDEAASEIKTVQPEIKYEAFYNSYMNCLMMCLQGILSPATLGIDVGKMQSADAQREKKDVTGNTRNTITSALEKELPKLIQGVLKTYDNMRGRYPGDYAASVSFGEYAAPDFNNRVETVGKASAYGVMSVETQVEELWGSSKDDNWKQSEVQRIMSERGLMNTDEISIGGA